MRKLVVLLVMLWTGLAAAQTPNQLPIRYGANGQPLTPYQMVPYFNWVGVDRSFPHSDLMCAQQIGFSAEHTTLLSNVPMNQAAPDPTQLATWRANPEPDAAGNPLLPAADWQGVTGALPNLISPVPTTDMLIRWTACKWGLDEDTMRAQFWEESNWFEDTSGDMGNSLATCSSTPYALPGTIYDTSVFFANNTARRVQQGCYQSYGLGQEKIIFLPTAYPMVKDSTPFEVDYRAAQTRGCINGDQVAWFTNKGSCTATATGHGNCNTSTGTDLYQGCVAAHFNGDWWSSAAQTYWNLLNGWITSKPWKTLP